jgi:hypothetical protein
MSERVGAKCKECGHVWIVLYLPMPMALAAKVARSLGRYCPKCGATGSLVAKDAELPEIMWHAWQARAAPSPSTAHAETLTDAECDAILDKWEQESGDMEYLHELIRAGCRAGHANLQAEITALRERVAGHVQLNADLAMRAGEQITRAEAAEADAARLDWLESRRTDLAAHQGAEPISVWSITGAVFLNIRAAIDAARADKREDHR